MWNNFLFKRKSKGNDYFFDISIIILVNTTSLKKIKLHIEGLHSAKLKEEKASKKSTVKGKGKSVKMDLDKVIFM